MDDASEELEPLFDYHRVQPINPICLDDDSDSSPAYIPKRRKFTKPDNKKVDDVEEDGKIDKPVVCVVDDDEEDWLAPPPKNAAPVTKRVEDSAIKELRMKKQELASLVQNSQNALRAAEEAAKSSAQISSDSCIEQTGQESKEEPLKPANDRAKIVISIQDKAGTKQYRVFADDKFEPFFKKYAEKAKIELVKLVFSFDGEKINPESTPLGLGMEDDDLIEVNVKPN